jgi:hypothetical protein
MTAATPSSSRPVDESIEPVSRSSPSPEAGEALHACDARGNEDRLDAIEGMGLVPHATDVPRYTYLWGVEPEIQRTDPVWVIQFAGRLTIDAYWADDPVCVVIDGRPLFFAPGLSGRGDASSNPEQPNVPTLRLPPLAP